MHSRQEKIEAMPTHSSKPSRVRCADHCFLDPTKDLPNLAPIVAIFLASSKRNWSAQRTLLGYHIRSCISEVISILALNALRFYRDKSIWILVLAIIIVSAFVSVRILNDPARRVRSAGAAYDPRLKSGKWIRPKNREGFDSHQLAIIVDAIKDFREPHALTVRGRKITVLRVFCFRSCVEYLFPWIS